MLHQFLLPKTDNGTCLWSLRAGQTGRVEGRRGRGDRRGEERSGREDGGGEGRHRGGGRGEGREGEGREGGGRGDRGGEGGRREAGGGGGERWGEGGVREGERRSLYSKSRDGSVNGRCILALWRTVLEPKNPPLENNKILSHSD